MILYVRRKGDGWHVLRQQDRRGVPTYSYREDAIAEAVGRLSEHYEKKGSVLVLNDAGKVVLQIELERHEARKDTND